MEMALLPQAAKKLSGYVIAIKRMSALFTVIVSGVILKENIRGRLVGTVISGNASFDLAANLAALFAGLAIEMTNQPNEAHLP